MPAISTATGARVRPMTTITGPVTTGEDLADPFGADEEDEEGEEDVDEPRGRDPAPDGAQRKARLLGRQDGGDEGEAGAQEDGDHPPRDQVENQGAHPGGEEGHGRVEAGEEGDQDGGPEHGHRVLEAQDKMPWRHTGEILSPLRSTRRLLPGPHAGAGRHGVVLPVAPGGQGLAEPGGTSRPKRLLANSRAKSP